MNKVTAKYLLLLVAAAVLFDWKTVLTNQFTLLAGSEAVNYTYGWIHFWISALRHGSIPLWDPYAFCGRPFAGEMLPSAYYPLHLLLLLVPFNHNGLFSPRLHNELFFFNHVLCLWFTFALIREFRLSRFAAFIGACCFTFSGLIAGMVWLPFVEAAIWLPAILLFLLRAMRAEKAGRRLLEASLSGLCLGMSVLTGGLHFAMMQGIVVITAAAFHCASTAPSAAANRSLHWRRFGLMLMVIVAVAGGAGAVQLFPAYEYSRLSLRYIDGGPFPAAEKIPYARLHPGMWPQSILTALSPAVYGLKTGSGESWGSYIGAFPFLLAITAIWRSWRILWVRYLAAVALLAFVYSLGEYSPFHGWLYALVPYLWTIRAPSRFVYLVSFALACLAAFGWDALVNANSEIGAWDTMKRIIRWVAVACVAALCLPALSSQFTIDQWMSLSLLLILGACGWLAYLTSKPVRRPGRAALAAFILFDLTTFHWAPTNRAAPAKPDEMLDQVISLRGVTNFIKAQPGLWRVRVAVSPEPNIEDIYGVPGMWGGGGTVLTSYSKLAVRDDLLNVRFIVRPASVSDPGYIYNDEHWKVYENPKAYPRVWLLHKTVVEQSEDAVFRRVAEPSTDLRSVAVLESKLPEDLQESSTGESVRVESYAANRVVLDVTESGTALLVMGDMYYPGWRATLNGTPAVILKVDGGLRGIRVPPGRSRIELRYAPVSIYAGGAISLGTFAVVAIALALAYIRRTRNAHPKTSPAYPNLERA